MSEEKETISLPSTSKSETKVFIVSPKMIKSLGLSEQIENFKKSLLAKNQKTEENPESIKSVKTKRKLSEIKSDESPSLKKGKISQVNEKTNIGTKNNTPKSSNKNVKAIKKTETSALGQDKIETTPTSRKSSRQRKSTFLDKDYLIDIKGNFTNSAKPSSPRLETPGKNKEVKTKVQTRKSLGKKVVNNEKSPQKTIKKEIFIKDEVNLLCETDSKKDKTEIINSNKKNSPRKNMHIDNFLDNSKNKSISLDNIQASGRKKQMATRGQNTPKKKYDDNISDEFELGNDEENTPVSSKNKTGQSATVINNIQTEISIKKQKSKSDNDESIKKSLRTPKQKKNYAKHISSVSSEDIDNEEKITNDKSENESQIIVQKSGTVTESSKLNNKVIYIKKSPNDQKSKCDNENLKITPKQKVVKKMTPVKAITDTPDTSDLITSEKDESVSDLDTSEILNTPQKEKKKRGRSKKICDEKQDSLDISTSSEILIDSPNVSDSVKKKGKQKSVISESNTPKENSTQKLVKCMTCSEEILQMRWNYHNLSQHNNLSWREGDEPIDTTNEKVVMKILTQIAKSKKQLKCSKCGVLKKSAAGFLSHLTQCQLSKEEIEALRIPCEICGRLYAKLSIKVHMQQAHSEKAVFLVPEPVSTYQSDGTRLKRKAAKVAASLIKDVTVDDETEKTIKVNPLKKFYSSPGKKRIIYSVVLAHVFTKALKQKSEISCGIRNCTYKTKGIQELKEHLLNCPEIKPNDYICRYCLHIAKSEENIISHVKKNHFKDDQVEENEFSDDEEEDYEDEEIELEDNEKKFTDQAKFSKYRAHCGIQFFDKAKLELPLEPTFNKICFKWTKEYMKKHYVHKRSFSILKCLRSDWKKLKHEIATKYYPKKTISPYVSQILMTTEVINPHTIQHEWKQYKLFNSNVSNDVATIYCGGQIYAMAWAPTPIEVIADQILAVSVETSHNISFAIGKSYKCPHSVQFWNFGKLTNENEMNTPKLAFCLAIDHGAVWFLEWCPSGFYDFAKSEDPTCMKRLGILAMACSDGTIILYSICHPDSIGASVNARYFKPRESVVLLTNTVSYQCYEEEKICLQTTKISWSKSKNHFIIVGGYSTGMVSVWDLRSKSPLLYRNINGKVYLYPIHTFQAHDHVITALSLHVTDGGSRWLMTGSWDQTSKFWDLDNTAFPVTVHKKGLVTDGVWLTNWATAFTCYEDTYLLEHCNSTVQTIRDFGFKIGPSIGTNSVVNGVSENRWMNGVAQCNLAGELSACFPRQLLYGLDDKFSKAKKMMIQYCELIEKTLPVEKRLENYKNKFKTPQVDISDKDDEFLLKNCEKNESTGEELNYFEPEPTTYSEIVHRYGIAFCDFQLKSFKEMPNEMKHWFRQSVYMHKPNTLCPMNSINRCAWNPNYQAHLYIASGLDSGFVRLHCLRFLKFKNVKPE